MPLTEYSLELVHHALTLARADLARTGKVLCLSTPDVIAKPARVEEMFGLAAGSLSIRADSAAIIGWHKAKRITELVVDTAALFAAVGFEMTALDIVEGRGNEVIHDLSQPLPSEHRGRYDLVFDCVSNQVFRASEAMASVAAAVRVGGYALHVIPVTMVNQGFWCVSPTAYHDFYGANGFTLVVCRAVRGVYEHLEELSLHPLRRERNVPDDVMNVVLARKDKEVSPAVWPMMTKFLLKPLAKTEPVRPHEQETRRDSAADVR